MDFAWIVIVIVFLLLDKGHESENLQKECLFLLYYLFPMYMKDSSESCLFVGNGKLSRTEDFKKIVLCSRYEYMYMYMFFSIYHVHVLGN